MIKQKIEFVREEMPEVITNLDNNKDFIQIIKSSLLMVLLENELISNEVFDSILENELISNGVFDSTIEKGMDKM